MKPDNDIDKGAEYLKSSPVFNLSLSSLELFHSNFIYWMLRQDEFADKFTIFSNFDTVINEKGKELELKEVTREEQNLDIVLKFKSRASENDDVVHTLVIENKFKSLPTSEQLKLYSEKKINSDSVSYILLSLSNPVFFDKNRKWVSENGKSWKFMNNADLALHLENKILKIYPNNGNYKLKLIGDYRRVIKLLHDIFFNMGLNDEEKFLFEEDNGLAETLRTIRFRDFYVKKRAEKFCFDVYQQLKKEISNIDAFKDFGTGLKIKEKGKKERKITVNSGMTRGQALCDFKYRVSNNLVFGVQLQGNQYRKTIEGPSSKGREVRRVAEGLLSSKNYPWFDLSDRVHDGESRLYPKSGKDFNKYGNNFFYRSFYLDGTEKVNQIKQYVLEDMKYLHEHKEELAKLSR